MSESFDDMMRREFGDDFGEAPAMEAKLGELCEHYALPHEAVLYLLELVMDLLRPLARLRTFGDRCEAEGVVPTGFRRELEALIIRQLTLLSQSEH
jgi:hypothetical protein